MSAVPFAVTSLLCPIIAFGVILLVVVLILRTIIRAGSRASTGVGAPLPSQALTELAVDGFWILPCAAPPLSTIHYYYWSAGARHAGRVSYQPGPDGRQFVYTGLRPEQVAVSRVIQPDSYGGTDLDIPGLIIADSILNSSFDDNQPPPPSPPPAPPSFPSAY